MNVWPRTYLVELTTTNGETAEGQTPAVTGEIDSITYEKVDFTDGVDVRVVVEKTKESVWSQDNVNSGTTVSPRRGLHKTDGSAATYDGTNQVVGPIRVCDSPISIRVTKGGSVKRGRFHVTVNEMRPPVLDRTSLRGVA